MKYKNEIVQGDCLEVMKDMEADSIDLTVTSPPYDKLRDYKGYKFNFGGIAKELYRITKSGGVVVWVVGDATVDGSETGTSFKQALYFKEIGFNLHDTMIYQKANYVPLTHNRYEQEWEYMFVFSKGKPITFNPIKIPVLGVSGGSCFVEKDGTTREAHSKRGINTHKIKPNVWKYVTGQLRNGHPAPFPEQLANDHIISWSNEEDTVLDPMCGSGTTCKMAKMNNRNYIGIEVSAEYAEIARRRVEATHYQPDLFGICGYGNNDQRKGINEKFIV